MEQEQAGLGRDGHLDFVGQHQTAAAFEDLFGQQDLNEPLKLTTVGLGKAGVEADVLFDEPQPVCRKRRGPQSIPPATLEQAEHVLCLENALKEQNDILPSSPTPLTTMRLARRIASLLRRNACQDIPELLWRRS